MAQYPVYSETYIFWDIMDYPLPKDRYLQTLYSDIKEALFDHGYGGYLCINAYAEKDNNLYKELNYLQRSFHILRRGSRLQRLEAMVVDMLAILLRDDPFPTPPPRMNFFLVIKDMPEDNSEVATVVNFLRERHYNIVLVVPDDDEGGFDSAYPYLKEQQSNFTLWRWSSLVAGRGPIGDTSSEDSEDYDSEEEEESSPKRAKNDD